jgi:TRAP-type C4-dicarboxylate transport system permease small subunit
MSVLKALLRLLHKVENSALWIALATMLALALLQIVLRNFFDTGLLWVESFLRILVLWLAMLGAMIGTRERNHIRIDILSRFASMRAKVWLSRINALFASMICLVATYASIQLVAFEYQDGLTAFAWVPVWFCQLILPVGFLVMFLRFARDVFMPIRGEL